MDNQLSKYFQFRTMELEFQTFITKGSYAWKNHFLSHQYYKQHFALLWDEKKMVLNAAIKERDSYLSAYLSASANKLGDESFRQELYGDFIQKRADLFDAAYDMNLLYPDHLIKNGKVVKWLWMATVDYVDWDEGAVNGLHCHYRERVDPDEIDLMSDEILIPESQDISDSDKENESIKCLRCEKDTFALNSLRLCADCLSDDEY